MNKSDIEANASQFGTMGAMRLLASAMSGADLTLEATKPDAESLTKRERLQAAWIANELLSRGGWTGAQRDMLERIIQERDDDDDILQTMEEMRDARDREDALKP